MLFIAHMAPTREETISQPNGDLLYSHMYSLSWFTVYTINI